MPPVSAFATHQENSHVVRLGDDELHLSDRGELALYDIALDPEEVSPRGADAAEKVAQLREELQRWLDDEQALRRRVARGPTQDLAPDALRLQVTSPGGTTERALAVLRNGGFSPLVKAAIKAAEERARELARDFGSQ